MKTGFKRLAILLAVAMLCGSMVYPTTAAEDVTNSTDKNYTEREDGTTKEDDTEILGPTEEITTNQKYGDGTGDGVVNAADALMVLEIAAGIKVIDATMKTFLDVNGDGVINASDALNVLEYSANIIVKFPVEEQLPEPTKEPEITEEPKPTREPDKEYIPGEIYQFGNSSYCVQYADGLTWEQAEEACEAQGGHLATITSAEEQLFIEALNAHGDYLWLGGYEISEGDWRWITGEAWVYTNWDEGEPNDLGDEGCLVLWPYKWNDLASDNLYEQWGYICEWDGQEVIPKPTKEPAITEAPEPTEQPIPEKFPEGTQRFGDSYYYIQIHGELTWEGAEAACEAMGGHLATITSEEEQRFIEALNAHGDSLWIGGFRSYDGNWKWITGEAWGYTYWGYGEPNNSSNVVSNERYVTVWPYEWNDLANKNIYEQWGYICEWDAYEVVERPEPDVTPEPEQRPAYIPENAQKYGNSYYLIVDAYEIRWEDAKTACEEMKGHLACITSQEEQAYIDALNEWDADLWLGGYKNLKESWNWVTDEAWNYTNWIVTDSWDFDGDLGVRTMGPGWYRQHRLETAGIDGYICEWEIKEVQK